ncbi:uncharacterized protein B4U80_10330, partial [Leptotrombidium deliense]
VDVNYFRTLVSSENSKLEALCKVWTAIAEKENVSEDVLGQINSVKGQALLLMSERFKQFKGLIDDCENKTSEKEITSLDLQGFWDMIYFQVEDVRNKFAKLDELKRNDWKEKSDSVSKKEKKCVKKVTKSSGKMKTVRSTSALRDHIMKERAKFAKSTSAGELIVTSKTTELTSDTDSAFSSTDSVYSPKCHFELGEKQDANEPKKSL